MFAIVCKRPIRGKGQETCKRSTGGCSETRITHILLKRYRNGNHRLSGVSVILPFIAVSLVLSNDTRKERTGVLRNRFCFRILYRLPSIDLNVAQLTSEFALNYQERIYYAVKKKPPPKTSHENSQSRKQKVCLQSPPRHCQV